MESLHQFCCHTQLVANLLIQTSMQRTQGVLVAFYGAPPRDLQARPCRHFRLLSMVHAIERFQLSLVVTPTVLICPLGPNMSHLPKCTHTYTNSIQHCLSKWPKSNELASGHWVNTPAASNKHSSWLSSLSCPRCKRPFATDVTPSASSSTHDSNLKQVVCNCFLDCFPSAVYIRHSAPSSAYFLSKEPSYFKCALGAQKALVTLRPLATTCNHRLQL